MTNPNEIWQVEVKNQIYEANVEELCQWIAEGALLPADRVRRGNLRWIEAGKIPMLHGFFNAKEKGLSFPVLQTLTDASPAADILETENFATAQSVNQTDNTQTKNQTPALPIGNQTPNACHFHAGETAVYVCDGCANLFCNQCPNSYGGSVKICPLCGAMCRLIADVQTKRQKDFQHQNALSKGFGFADFGNALLFPFRFKTSLFFGALMFMFFTLGESGAAFGGTFLIFASIFCAMLANTLTFGCLANTIENFSQGNVKSNFMPNFDEFALWDDVIHPFFLSLGTYVISFGLLAVLAAGAYYYAMKSVNQIEADKQKMVSTVLPDAASDLNSAKQIPQISELTNQLKKSNEWQNGEMPDANRIANMQSNVSAPKVDSQKIEQMINQSRQAGLESAIGGSSESENEGLDKFAANILRLSMIFSIPIFLAFLWGVFYFPAACCVAGYTRSLAAVLNPAIGLDTIKRLGFNYAKILLIFFVLGVFSFFVSFILGKLFAPFDLPRMGNLPAKVIGSLFTFYFSIVFSVALGYALYKSSARFNFRSN
ncbi:MAG: hypothetical protein ACR2HG_11720 [Pyrinomonadaceae bacterium]